MGNGVRSKEFFFREQEEKLKIEQGAKRDEKGAVKIGKNATWRWQWALPVSAITPCSFADMTFSKSAVNNKYKPMGMYFYKLVQGQIERATMDLHVIVSF